MNSIRQAGHIGLEQNKKDCACVATQTSAVKGRTCRFFRRPRSISVDPEDPPCYTFLSMGNITRKKNVRITFTEQELERAHECAHIRRLSSLNEYVRTLLIQDAAALGLPPVKPNDKAPLQAKDKESR